MSEMDPARFYPWEMVLASAGSGKTYRLSGRVIGLLAQGESIESILATTFTRKAAAEILERVLIRLAKGACDADLALKLGEDVRLPGDERPAAEILDQDACRLLLGKLLRNLHRFNVGTLDSFFMRVAGCFSAELGLAPGWRIADESTMARVRGDALDALLSAETPEEMMALLRLMAGGESGKGVHSSLQGKVATLLALARDVDPTVASPWSPDFAGVACDTMLSAAERARRRHSLAGKFEKVAPPLTRGGKPDSRWRVEILRLAATARQGRWQDFFAKGLGAKLVAEGHVTPGGEIEFYRKNPDDLLAPLLDEACALAREELAVELRQQSEALGRLTDHYREAFAARQRQEGAYGYEDVTEALRADSILHREDDLRFRLDGRIRHLLLDEFQDTSLPQWDVLVPMLASSDDGQGPGRAAVLVADPKQSIYGWRGARPELAEQVRHQLHLREESLPRSYRSSQVILDVVAEVFGKLSANSMIQEFPDHGNVARAWAKNFLTQEAAHVDRPGFVCMVAGPEPLGRGSLQPGGLDHAVRVLKKLRGETPWAEIGVLVRQNNAVAYLIAALQRAGIPASGEGGTPLTDAAPVNALLALLRLADHPGDTIARYHVAMTPLGPVVGYEEYGDGASADQLARAVRARLLAHGYGASLAGWMKELAPVCNQREGKRLQQLVELGFRWDPQATLRPTEFIRFVERERVQDPSGARVRVMTIHQCKGLEFDVVVLPQLHLTMDRCRPETALPLRDPDSGRVRRIYPLADKNIRALFPEMGDAYGQLMAAGIRDELSGLYVAMTRARYALHMIIPADGEKGPGSTRSPARLLRAALAPGKKARQEDGAFFEAGDPRWFEHLAGDAGEGGAGDETSRATPGPILLRKGSGERPGNLPTVTPSQLEGGESVDLAAFMRMDQGGRARLHGTLIHHWFEVIQWIDESDLPPDEQLRELAARHAPGMEAGEVNQLLADFRGWLKAPALRHALSRTSYPSGARVEREMPFVRRVPAGIMRGVIDRLVLVEEKRGGGTSRPPAGRVIQVEVLDFKTDHLGTADTAAIQARSDFYRPQIEAYKAAMVDRYSLDPRAVTGALLFVRHGMKIEI